LDDLDFPVSMTWAPGTELMFFTQREGSVRTVDDGRLLDEPCVTVPASAVGENDGLLGIEASPHFANDRHLFVYYSDIEKKDNRVVRFTVHDDLSCGEPKTIIDSIPLSSKAAKRHNGGQIEFVGDHLFVSIGENDDAALAQDLSSLGGKILRVNANGSVPSDNPFAHEKDADERIWAYGFRNPFGLGRASDGRIFVTDNGPGCDDELDLLRAGANYGWAPEYEPEACRTDGLGDDPTGPAWRWTALVSPSDPLWYQGELGALNGLVVGDYHFGFLHSFVFDRTGTVVLHENVYRVLEGSALLDASVGPDGALYLIATDYEGRGKIVRLVST
jgi:glucose/arabinose dehydrogenase